MKIGFHINCNYKSSRNSMLVSAMCYSKSPNMNNNDVMSDILLRLPLKDFVGCKCVCKLWNTLISDPAKPSVQYLRVLPTEILVP
ncbi:hypothetical protein J1N35_020654 [Gossypium stocksii]|uniref:F-box domain-containing protein n=1 Tax=Gossypium stocksii TaxID=47602 RepID=A0A9D3VD13_9ROSI|nr:hypothetical protein J1N35_020654 [Gossypium stocksii]